MIEVIFLAGAETDVQAAYERRESFREGAGDRFLGELDRLASAFAAEIHTIYQLVFRYYNKNCVSVKVITSKSVSPTPRLPGDEFLT